MDRLKTEIRESFLSAGAVAVGFARSEPVSEEESARYSKWIEEGKHAGMEYMRRHVELKLDPRNVLENAATVISLAFSYAPERFRDDSLPVVASYAYGEDYHDVIRRRLSPPVERLRNTYGGEWRICVDSAPLAERYWALRSGIGRLGRNGSVIVDNFGSYIFLAEVMTTLPVTPDEPTEALCAGCGACVSSCPVKALDADGSVDSRRCLNYLTIEHRGDWAGDALEVMRSDAGKHTLYGCDVCQRVCPHNVGIKPTGMEEFRAKDGIMSLRAEDVAAMTQADFSAFFRGSAMKRAKLDGMRRNALNVLNRE